MLLIHHCNIHEIKLNQKAVKYYKNHYFTALFSRHYANARAVGMRFSFRPDKIRKLCVKHLQIAQSQGVELKSRMAPQSIPAAADKT